ncbi:MAG: T9SS type A sorting domain-containing protein [Bacteroidales bacterium]|jgi:hypothetical protein|nr:T9SS type A sorting domain-containing protein [Bacteroidales bacterium]
MKKYYFILISVLLTVSLTQAQNKYPEGKYSTDSLKPLTNKEQQKLRMLPELKLPTQYKNMSLPYAVDNSTQPYMRDIFNQSGLDCGQAAAVAIGFTYEINRLRNLASDQLSTTYPSYFVWNWENGGNGWYGVSYYHSMDILRMVGTPNLDVYEENVNGGDGTRFMSGYDKYLHAMTNRIRGAYSINVSDEEGLENFKHWLDHHHEGSNVGGVAFFYSQYQSPSNTLPTESEHAGEKVITSWGSSPNHGMAIAGYNDSIKYDYNGDGQFTNHIDINNDGVVDMKDWEIGAVLMNNTYHSYPANDWGNEGYAWMMYRTLALDRYSGGIWNNTVNVLKAKENYAPQLTMKIQMEHNKRQRVKMNVGMTTNLSSDEPMYLLDFPIFDFQGADQRMQGGSDEGAEFMEFGYDLTPFLNYLQPGETAKFIFQLEEDDPDSTGTGEFISMSLIDYTGATPIETDCGQNNLALVDNGMLKVPVTASINFDPPEITTESFPVATIYEPYSHQLLATNGTEPYSWSWDMDFEIENEIGTYPSLSGSSISTGGANYAEYELPFEFPYYDSVYSSIYVYKTGAIMMEALPTDLPYNSDDDVVFFNRKMIAALYMEENGSLGSPALQSVENADNVHFIWSSTDYQFSIRLYEDGSIKMYYGDNNLSDHQRFVAGASSGDQEFAQILPISNAESIQNGLIYTLTPHQIPDEFAISEDGLVSGTPTQQYLAEPLPVRVKDENNLINKKIVPISTDGFIIDYAFHTTNNDVLETGETATMDITLINETEENITGVSVSLSSTHPAVTITDDTEFFGDIDAASTPSISDAFSFDIGHECEDGEELDFIIHVTSDQENWERPITEIVYAPKIVALNAAIDDGDNGRLDEGENADYLLTVSNAGGGDIQNVSFLLTSDDEYLTINTSSEFSANLPSEAQDILSFNLSADAATPLGHVAPMMLYVNNDNYSDSIQLYLSIGLIVEDWETSDMEQFSWYTEGTADWFISDDTSFNGSICLESGDINDSQLSTVKIGVQVLTQDTIRFHRKVSCEQDANNTNWDYLAFLIDGVEQARWDGEQNWEQFSYPVSSGFRIFEWKYIKDGSVSNFEDCAWIDDIIFPSIYDAPPQAFVSVDSIYKQMPMETTDTDTIFISNIGGGILGYNLELRNVPENTQGGKSIAGSTLSCSADNFIMGESVNWDLTVTNGSTDSEWIKNIMINFPSGMEIISATDFYDSNDTLFSNEILGDGVIITWFNETDAGWGIITGGETATASISADIAEDFSGDLEIEYQFVGDIYGADPHYINDILVIENLGPPIDWLQISPESGQAHQPNTDSIILHWDTHGMEPGMYEAELMVYLTNDTLIIPVSLEVTWPVDIEPITENMLEIYPNPTHDILYINLNGIDEKSELEIIDIQGRVIMKQSLNANQKNTRLNCQDLPQGSYIIRFISGDHIMQRKFIKM